MIIKWILCIFFLGHKYEWVIALRKDDKVVDALRCSRCNAWKD